MRILAVNPGSSTLKVQVLEGDEVLDRLVVDPWRGDQVELPRRMLDVDAVGFRVVHGGTAFSGPTLLTREVVERIEALTSYAPLHQPRAVRAIRAVTAAVPGKPGVVCFDTAFHASLPPAAATYALPATWNTDGALRRYGFHGLSHEYAAARAAAHRVVTCHLGAGASLCAVLDGRSIDTTMGFTPIEGLIMATRTGSVDPGLVLWLITEGKMAPTAVLDGMQEHGGLAGLSGTSGDMREVLGRRDAGDARASLAFDAYIHRLRREIAAMAAALGGLDALVFTGGVGEHQPDVRAASVAGLGFLGVELDGARNAATTSDGDISAAGAPVRTLVVTAREEVAIASQVRRLLSSAT